MTQGRLFGSAARAYERYRLGYADEVADLVLAYARPPVARALEVGAGTGKATRLFAGRGIAVVAVEPDAAMLAVLAEQTARLPVHPVAATFEAYATDVRTTEPFDLLYAAAAWHWTEAETRWPYAAALVRPGGTVAFAGSAGAGSHLVDPDLQAEVVAIRTAAMGPVARLTEERSASGIWWPGSEIVTRPEFTDLEEHQLPRTVGRSREDYLGHLSTVSNYLQLAPDDRHALLDRIGAVLPDRVEVDAALTVHLARRTQSGSA